MLSEFLHLSQTDSGRLPISWLVFLLALGGDPQGLSPFQFLLFFDTISDAVCQHFFISFSPASFYALKSNLLNRLLRLLCCLHHHRMKYCGLGRIHRLCYLV